jgi:hypothetical protein
MARKFISINQCPDHKAFWMISLDDEDGCGTRLLGGKCCGHWQEIKRFALDREKTEAICDELMAAIDEQEIEERRARRG